MSVFEFRGAVLEVWAGKEAPGGDENIRSVTDVGSKECVVGLLRIRSSYFASFIVSRENGMVLTTLECRSDKSPR